MAPEWAGPPHPSGSCDVTLAQHLHTLLSPQRLIPPVCFTREDQCPLSAVSGLVSFCASEEEVAIDDSMSLTASDGEERVCSGEEPEAPSPFCVALCALRADPCSHESCGGAWPRMDGPGRARPRLPRRVALKGTPSTFFLTAASSVHACGSRRAH